MKTIAKKNSLITQTETNQGEEIEELLRRLYVDENLTYHEIAETLHISYVTVGRWLRKSGIRSRRINLGE